MTHKLKLWHKVLAGLAAFGLSGTTMTTVVYWAIDVRLDQKYATDVDVDAIGIKIDAVQGTVSRNSSEIQEVNTSVDTLTMLVLESEIKKYEKEISILAEKAALTVAERVYLTDQEKRLSDLKIKRAALFKRIIGEG